MKVAIRLIVLLALGGLLIYLASNLTFKNVQVPSPLRGEAARNPFYAAIRLSDLLGAKASWERVFAVPPANGVIYLSNYNWSLSRTRRERMQQWVEAGGRLIVDDSVMVDIEQFETWSGVDQYEFEVPDEDFEEDDEDPESTDEDAEVEEPAAPPRFFARRLDDRCSPLSEDGSDRKLEVCDVNRIQALTSEKPVLWALRDDDGIHAIRTPVGRGSVTVINATPFRYRDFLDADHARLFVVATQLQRGDIVMFLTEEDQPPLLSLLWHYGWPAVLLLLAGVGLALWRVTPRFGPRTAPTESARRSLAEQIRGTGLFALRFGGGAALHKATLRALRDAAIHRFPGFDHMSASERVAALGKLPGVDADELGPALNFSGARTAHELRQAIAILESARRQLLSMKKAKHGN